MKCSAFLAEKMFGIALEVNDKEDFKVGKNKCAKVLKHWMINL